MQAAWIWRHRMMNRNVKKLTFLALAASVALILSYVEALLPPLFAAVPGIKAGLPNIVIIFLLYRFGLKDAATVSLVRMLLVTLLFGNPMMLLYSLAGAFLSLSLMTLCKKADFLSPVGVSIVGGVAHNLGQILVAICVLETVEIGYYMIVLAISGSLAGILIGLAGAALLKTLKNVRL